MADAQNFANHRRFVPAYHFVIMPILLLNIVFAGYGIWQGMDQGPTVGPDGQPMAVHHALPVMAIWHLIAGIGVAGLGMTRTMAITVQDRVILLEMRLRLADILPADLKARSRELTKSQVIGLRFASDGEMAGLVTRCLAGELKNGEAVKKEIKTWVPDTQRC